MGKWRETFRLIFLCWPPFVKRVQRAGLCADIHAWYYENDPKEPVVIMSPMCWYLKGSSGRFETEDHTFHAA